MVAVMEKAWRRWVVDNSGGSVIVALANAVIAAQGDENAQLRARRDAPETSRQVMDKIRAGSLGDHVLKLFFTASLHPNPDTGEGWTDDELEQALNRSHQSVSAARNTLMRRGYVVATDERRNTRWGNPAVVYVWTGKDPVR